ncbi:MAG: CoA transferase [Hyphomicrobiales bacterium]|nr:CoA transferase [Hyphomicrobiales bacterium]
MRPLEGLVVVAVEQAVAAPYCTSRLADAGARVLKIERPEGDFARGYDDAAKGQSSYFVWLNRGKESVVLDLSTEEDRTELGRLIEKADVLVQNLKPGALGRLGFPVESLRARHPALICCSISGYGDTGPLAQRKAYDLLIQTETGLTSITGGPESPGRVGVSIVDIATGATAHAAILEALIARGVNGKGSDIRISMFDVMADWLTVPLLNAEAGKPPKRVGLGHPTISPYGVFTSKDGKPILISIQNDREWRSLCKGIIGEASLGEDPRFATNLARVRHRPQTDGRVAEAFAAATHDELVERLTKADIAFAEVNGMEELSRHPHLRRASLATPNGEISYPAPAAIFDGKPRRLGAVPELGADTQAIRRETAKMPKMRLGSG